MNSEVKKRIFFIGMEEQLLSSIVEILASYPEIEIVGSEFTASQGIEGVKKLKPDVVFIERDIEEVDVLDIVRILKKFASSLKVIVLSYSTDALWLQAAVDSGISEFISKPFDPIEIYKFAMFA